MKKHQLIILGIAIVLIGIIVLILMKGAERNPSLIETTGETHLSLSEGLDIIEENKESATVRSLEHGISFTVPYSERIAVTKEEGRIYVHTEGADLVSGQWIEVFRKDPVVSLDAAITEQFLSNYSTDDCFVGSLPFPYSKEDSDKFEVRIITYPTPSIEDSEELGPAGTAYKCPNEYTTSMGLSYFLMDKNHPDKYAYIFVGQEIIPSRTNDYELGWHDTVQFTE
ncbi:MAG: hypothetical protein Q8P73_04030 [bacterium]|nr:hypothetical protein [bacterium]